MSPGGPHTPFNYSQNAGIKPSESDLKLHKFNDKLDRDPMKAV